MWKLKCNEIKIKYFADILLTYENIIISFCENNEIKICQKWKLYIFVTDIFEAIRYIVLNNLNLFRYMFKVDIFWYCFVILYLIFVIYIEIWEFRYTNGCQKLDQSVAVWLGSWLCVSGHGSVIMPYTTGNVIVAHQMLMQQFTMTFISILKKYFKI